MRFLYEGQYFYLYSGSQFQNEIHAEVWSGFSWQDVDLTQKIEIVKTEHIMAVELYPDLAELAIHFQNKKEPVKYKFEEDSHFHHFIRVLQSGLHFSLM